MKRMVSGSRDIGTKASAALSDVTPNFLTLQYNVQIFLHLCA